MEGRRHDINMCKRSCLDSQLENILLMEQFQYHANADSAYGRNSWIFYYKVRRNLTEAQRNDKKDKCETRYSVELYFVEEKRY